MKFTKNRYLATFFTIVVVLALVRCSFPDLAKDRNGSGNNDSTNTADTAVAHNTTDATKNIAPKPAAHTAHETEAASRSISFSSRFFAPDGSLAKNRIYSVPRFCDAFPDSNNVQLDAAMRHGVSPVLNRHDAEQRKKELVYVGASPYYTVDRLRSSIPYLVPKAAVLLDEIGRNFFDSLQMKNVPLHKFIITSVLRTREDIDRLRGHNHNATINSCHLYGTTFDVCYNRYTTVSDPDGKPRRAVRNDTLKWVLSEVLRDLRVNKRCYVKYEVKQGCFHITVRD